MITMLNILGKMGLIILIIIAAIIIVALVAIIIGFINRLISYYLKEKDKNNES